METVKLEPNYDAIRAMLAAQNKILCADGDIVEAIAMRDVKPGEFIRRKPDAKTTYTRGPYDRSAKKYAALAEDDISREFLIAGDTLVYIGFTY